MNKTNILSITERIRKKLMDEKVREVVQEFLDIDPETLLLVLEEYEERFKYFKEEDDQND